MTTSTSRNPSRSRALPAFGLAAAGALLAASAMACGETQQGFMFDESLWRQGVVAAGDEWKDEDWYQVVVDRDAVRVRAAQPREEDAPAGGETLYVNIPGTRLVEGVRVNHLFTGGLRPEVGARYALALGRTEFAFTVKSDVIGTQYVIEYGGATYNYVLGLPAAATVLHAVADLDGDRNPDFLVEVGEQVFLLLSTHAEPGPNLPSAQYWAAK